MGTPKLTKSSDKQAYRVKYSDTTGGAYADIKAVIQSELEKWSKSDKASHPDRQQDLNGIKSSNSFKNRTR